MFWQKAATERYKSGGFTFNDASFETQLTSTEAPDGSIMLMHQGWLRRNGVESTTPTLHSGWTSLGTASGGPINWDGQNWYYTSRLSWAVANSTVRATTPDQTFSDPIYRSWMKLAILSDNGEALTATVKTIGDSVNLSDAKAPATLIRASAVCCHEYPSDTVMGDPSDFFVDGGSTPVHIKYSHFRGNGDPNWMANVGFSINAVDLNSTAKTLSDTFGQGSVTTSQGSAVSQEREHARTALLIEAS